jgi:hypothetical protein
VGRRVLVNSLVTSTRCFRQERCFRRPTKDLRTLDPLYVNNPVGAAPT